MRRTSARSVPTAFQLSIFGQGDSLARTLLCQEKDPGYTEHELACFLNSLDYCGNAADINPAGLSLKMLRDCFQWAEQGILPRFSLNWPHWGMVLNMRFSTPAHLESLKTGRGYTLSEILQPEVSQAAEGGEPGSRWKRQRGKILSFRATDGEALNQVIGGPQGSRIYSTDGVSPTLTSGGGGLGTKTGLYFVKKDPQNGIVTKEKCGTIDASYYKGLGARQQRTGVMETSLPQAVIQPDKEKTWQNGRRIKGPDEAMFTMMASCVHGVLLDSRIRRLTPLEAFRLQGVPDEYFERAAAECSDSQLYKQAGNAVTVPVVRMVGQRIREYLETEK